MDMHSREQYLAGVREEYRKADKKGKTRLLNEARKRTRLSRKVLIRKLAHPAPLPKAGKRRRRRAAKYGVEILAPLVRIWEMFDYPCGQRLKAILAEQVPRLRRMGEVKCTDEVAALLEQVSPKTVDRLLGRERKALQLKRGRSAPAHPLLYQRIPVKTAGEWDRKQLGNLQADFVLHCGRTTAGEYVVTLSVTDIATGWWEGEPQMGRSQRATLDGVKAIERRLPFGMREIHPDNDSAILSELLWEHCQQAGIALSRSRPYQKNDNAWVEQKNWTHVRKVVGYRRYETAAQQELLRELYGVLADYKNFFQPAMKLSQKVRVGGKLHRVYEQSKTPYQRVLETGALTAKQSKALRQRYESLNPAELKRRMEDLRNRLFDSLEGRAEGPSRAKPRWPGLELHSQRQRRLRAAKGEA